MGQGEELSNISRMLGHEATGASEAAELSQILACVFGRKTSVVYDSKAIIDLF